VKTDPNDTAFPLLDYGTGLTKREWFAGMAMQGFAADPKSNDWSVGSNMDAAVIWADALIAALNKESADDPR